MTARPPRGDRVQIWLRGTDDAMLWLGTVRVTDTMLRGDRFDVAVPTTMLRWEPGPRPNDVIRTFTVRWTTRWAFQQRREVLVVDDARCVRHIKTQLPDWQPPTHWHPLAWAAMAMDTAAQ